MGKYGKNKNEELNHGILSAAWPQLSGSDRIQPRNTLKWSILFILSVVIGVLSGWF
jgi:hypothetical protein